MPKSIDPKSFIIGVLSAIVVCMAMGAVWESDTMKSWDKDQVWFIHRTTYTNPSKDPKVVGMEPFFVTKMSDGQLLYHYRKPDITSSVYKR